jgi:DNA-directed RNA polymerase specialized sigma24 family protein
MSAFLERGDEERGQMAEREAVRALPAHNFPSRTSIAVEASTAEHQNWQVDPDLWLYRNKTTALLRRYMRWSLEAGRVPSLLGRELFRARISAFTATTFEARVIFLHDVERCLKKLQGFDGQLIARVVLQEYDHETAARILQCTRKTLERRLPELIDELSESLLRLDLLERFPEGAGKRHD